MRKLKPKKGYYVSEYLYCILTPSCDSAELISSSVELLPVNVYMHNSFLYLKKKDMLWKFEMYDTNLDEC